MTDTTSRKTGQPKLRASCDNCGSLKLKCDRGQPDCGRCESMGLACVYGVSRKTGKPPRTANRNYVDTSISRPRALHTRNASREDRRPDPRHNGAHTVGPFGEVKDDFLVMDTTVFGPGEDHSSTWAAAAMDSYDTHMISLNDNNGMHTDFLGPSLQDCSIFRFNDDVGLAPQDTKSATVAQPNLAFTTRDGFSSSSHLSKNPDHDADTFSFLDDQWLSPICHNKNDCAREAYDILGRLNLYTDYPASRSSPESASATPNSTSTPKNIPLDHILCVNSECRTRLINLLNCSCARNSHLALLYASILSRMMTWYQEAAGCAQGDSCCRRVPSNAADTFLRQAAAANSGSPGASSLGGGSNSYWTDSTSATSSGHNTSVPSLSSPPPSQLQSMGFTTAPIAMGVFTNDDHQVQTALRIQIVLGEIKQTGSLIDLFTSQCSMGVTDGPTLTVVESLYRMLNVLLRREQARIADLVRSRIKEVNM